MSVVIRCGCGPWDGGFTYQSKLDCTLARSRRIPDAASYFLHGEYLPAALESHRLGPHPYRPTAMARTLLVVDDNQSVRESLRFLLLRRGYTVFVAEDGAAALALAAEHSIDGAIVDVNMPGMNGIEVCRVLRERAAAKGRDVAVWMMTGARTPDVLKHSREAGALDLLGKPFDIPSLYRHLEDRLGIRTYSNPPFQEERAREAK